MVKNERVFLLHRKEVKGEGAIIERADFNGRGNSFMKQFKFPPKCGISGHMTSPKVC